MCRKISKKDEKKNEEKQEAVNKKMSNVRDKKVI